MAERLIPKSMVSVTDHMEEQKPTNDLVVAFAENKDVVEQNRAMHRLVSVVQDRFRASKDNRLSDETRWLELYRNYRGIYGPEVQFTDTEKSQAFIKITKTKVLAAYAQIIDVLFSGNKFPIGISPTPVPVNAPDSIHIEAKPQGPQGPSTVTRPEILEALGPLTDKLAPVKGKIVEGPGKTPTSITYEPAKEAAKELEKLIHDQLEESNASKHLRSFAFEMALFGTGVFKGPTAKTKEYPKWTDKGEYKPLIKNGIADVCQVSIWDAYPDPDARHSIEEAEYFIQRHRMSRTQLRALKKRPYFRTKSIELAIADGPNYHNEYWEEILKDNENQIGTNRYEVLEYWGVMDAELAEEAGLTIPKELEDKDEIQVNAWICNDQILRIVLNPFTPMRIPYYACPYEINPYSFFGIGVAENMTDTQLLMNGFIRLAVDNAALSSNLIIEVDETNLVPGQDLTVYPGKVFRRQGGAPGQAIFGTKFPNVTQECLFMFDKARQLADEATGMPSFSHGMSGVMSTGRTASGMSMLMGAADRNIKAVIRNIDDYLLAPLGKAMFAFNMQFNFDKKFVGDLEVIALGTDSLMRNEVRSQKLLQFMQLTQNPMHAPFVKIDYLLRELAASMDLDPDKVVNDPREAGLQAVLLAEHQRIMGPPPEQQKMPGGNSSGVPQPSDPTGTGGGNIGPGMAPNPGAPGFTGGPPPNAGQGQAQQ